jgi:hypothetical protein
MCARPRKAGGAGFRKGSCSKNEPKPRRDSESPRAGNAPAFEQPAQFAAIIKADLLRRGRVVKASGFIADD